MPPPPGYIERVLVATPQQSAGGRVIASPFQFLVTGEDNLRISSANSKAGVSILVAGRFLKTDGGIIAFQFRHVPTSDRTIVSTNHVLGEGFLLNLTIVADAGSPRIGETFVLAKIIRGFTGATIVLGTLLQDYVTGTQEVAWPGSPIRSSVEGGGVVKAITIANPGAGVEFQQDVPTAARWRLLSLSTQFDASATVVSRRPALVLRPTLTTMAIAPQRNEAAASNSRIYSWSVGLPVEQTYADGFNVAGLPHPLPLPPASRIESSTVNLQAGDTYINILATVEEWLEAQ